MNGPTHYRYVTYSQYTYVQALLVTFQVLRETPRGYWVIKDFYVNFPAETQEKKRRWVSKDSRKRYCYPSKEQAWESYKIRCEWRVAHLERQLAEAKAAEALTSTKDKQYIPGRREEDLIL